MMKALTCLGFCPDFLKRWTIMWTYTPNKLSPPLTWPWSVFCHSNINHTRTTNNFILFKVKRIEVAFACHPCSIPLVSMPKYSVLSCATRDECHTLLAQENSSTCVPQEDLTCSLWAACWSKRAVSAALHKGIFWGIFFYIYNSFVTPVPSSQEWTLWMTTPCPNVIKHKPMYLPTL